MKGKKGPLPKKKMAHKKRKNASHMEEKAPSKVENTLHEFFFFQLEGRAPHALEQ